MQNAKPEFPFQPIAEYRAYKGAIDAAVIQASAQPAPVGINTP